MENRTNPAAQGASAQNSERLDHNKAIAKRVGAMIGTTIAILAPILVVAAILCGVALIVIPTTIRDQEATRASLSHALGVSYTPVFLVFALATCVIASLLIVLVLLEVVPVLVAATRRTRGYGTVTTKKVILWAKLAGIVVILGLLAYFA